MGDPEDTTRLSMLNATPTKLPGPELLHDLVGVTANHNRPAIDFLGEDGKRLTIPYHDFETLSDRLADRISQAILALPARHAEHQLIIPLMIPQCPDLYITLYAILKSGAAFCPINLDAPTERIKFILKDINADLILTNTALVQRISAAGLEAKLICVDQEDFTSTSIVEDAEHHGVWKRQAMAHDLAYVMYTSGSTGTPKGVGISHGAAVQSLLAHDKHMPPFARFLQFAAPTFDVSVFEIFFPLFKGKTLVCCDRTDLLSDLPGIICKMDVDACELTPSVAGSLLRSRTLAPCLQLVLTIGEMLTEPVVHEFGGNAQTPSILWGMYGPTEAAIHCTLQPAFQKNDSPKCIGIPLDTVSAFVIKSSADNANENDFEVVPIGEVGELVIGGYQLADGYLNRPEQTAASFIQTNFGRVYRTGDKARILSNGTIECLGRVAEGQIKLNGQRMELGEIEHVILRTKDCHGVYVCAISNVLVAFVAVESIADMHEKITANCKKWLPSFMVPSEIVVMQDFPRLPSGKVDRMRLKSEYSRSLFQDEHLHGETKSLNDLQRMLCSVAGDLLHTSVHISSRLSSLGLDSLSAIQLATQLRGQNIYVTPLDILDSETLQDLHKLIQSRENEPAKSRALANGHQEYSQSELFEKLTQTARHDVNLDLIEAVTQCTSLQTSMLVETLKDPRLYVNTVDVRLPLNVPASTVESWFSKLAMSNDIFRSGFVHIDDQIIRIVWRQFSHDQVIIVDEFSKYEITDADAFLAHPLQVQIHRSLSRATITVHHAIYDGWTIDLLLDDLNVLARGESLPARPQFHEIAQYLDTSQAESDIPKEFWAELLRGVGGAVLPNFRSTAIYGRGIEFAKSTLQVSSQEVLQVARASGVTPQAIFQACLAWLWSTITGSEDVTFGSVFSGRTLPIPGIERVMGPCLSTLPVRAKLAESSSILDLIRSLHLLNRQIMHVSPIKLPDIKRVAGIPQGSTLFDVLFVYQESLSSRSRGEEAVVELDHKDHIETKLLLEVEPHGDNYSCRWTYHSDSFSLPHVQAFAEQFSHLCSHFCQQIEAPLRSVRSSFPPLSLSAYTTGFKHLETCSSLALAIENQAALAPNEEALCFAHSLLCDSVQTESLTYQQLNEKANQIAAFLVARNISQGGIIAIIMEKSPLFYCGILGILKAGCAYLPLLPTTPFNRVKSVLEQSKPQVCFVEDLSSWNEISVTCPVVELHSRQFGHLSPVNLDISHDPTQPAYVIFTSGTTGVPKGVSVTNKNMLSNIKALSRIYPLEGERRMLQACSQAFDVSVFEIFFTWANGMCLCAATNDTLFNDLEESIRQFRVTHLSMTVTVASLVNPQNVPNVSFLVTSGEPMTDEVLNKWERVLYQGYGPSETTNICTVRKMQPGDSSQFLGWPLENTTAFVLYPDSDELVPTGGIGELCFGGDQVAAGYLNMPELTNSKFFKHSLYGRLYRSGDRGRMLPDGSLIILGRLDSQIKLRGQRIELQEIQSVVLGSGIAKACVSTVLEHENIKTQQLVMFYVPSSMDKQKFELLPLTAERKTETRLLFQTLEATLPSYMVPSFILPIACLPLTSSGKTNTEHILQSATHLKYDILDQCSKHTDDEETSNDWTDTEVHVLEALVATLDAEKSTISRWTSFTTLGLDSISAMPFSRKLQTIFHQKVPISQVLQNPSISRLARAIKLNTPDLDRDRYSSQAQFKLLPDELVDIVKNRFQAHNIPIEAILPCTPLQASMLVSTMSTGDGLSYRNQMLFRINCTGEEILAAWNQVYLRHGILRTCFMSTEDIQHPLVQIVLEPDELPWSRIRVSNIEEGAAQHLEALDQPLNTLKPPLTLALLTTDDQQSYLSFVCHHALYDGVAVEKLLSEVESLVRGQTLQQAPSFQHFLRESLDLPNDTDEFWSRHFEGFQPSHLPQNTIVSKAVNRNDGINGINGTNGTNSIIQSKTRKYTLPLSSLQAKLRTNGFSLLSLCQAAWFETLATVMQCPDICFGNVFSGRSVPLGDIDNLVAPCFNTVPLQIDQLVSLKTTDRKSSQGHIIPLVTSETPWTDVEEQVRHVVAKLAGIPVQRIGKTTSIYRLGLDSISVLQVASLLRQRGLSISPVDILDKPTCAGIASRTQSVDSRPSAQQLQYDLASFQDSVRRQVEHTKLTTHLEALLPCTPLQQGMLSQFILSEGANYYNFISWNLDLSTDCGRLQNAWNSLQGRLQILRTGFISIHHPDTSFAMLTYDSNSAISSVKSLKREQAKSFHTDGWRHQCILNAVRDLTQPPWQVVILEDDGSKTMHVGMHHALYDAISLQEMLDELLKIYEGIELHPPLSMEAATVSILGRVAQTQSGAEEFWKKQASKMVVNSFPTLTPLRIDERRRIRSSRLVSSSLQHLRQNAATAGVTIQSALQSAWTRILASYHGDAAVTFGVVLSGRTAVGLDQVVFPCITTLPVIAQNADSNRELLQSMMEYNATLRKYEHTPLTRIQRWTGNSESPIFDTILVYQGTSTPEGSGPWHITSETATVDYPISIEVEETQFDSLLVSIDFRRDILPIEHADLLLAQFDAILVHLLQSPDACADELVFQNQELYSITPPENRELPTNTKLLHEFVEVMADQSPDSLALEFVYEMGGSMNSRKWTYRQLDDCGNRIAHFLTTKDIRPGGIVAVCFDKCPEAYFAILGILKAGCAFVALDPSAPSSRHQFILEDSAALALMVKESSLPDIAFTSPCVVLEIDVDALEAFSESQLARLDISPNDNCYCLYTSGTTGTPKGCLITHDNAVQAMIAFQYLFEGHWDRESRWLQFASFHFDVSVLEQYWSWSVGIPVISAPRDLILSDLIATISDLQITHIDLTPSLARLVNPDDVPSLCKGVFITGGEQLRQDILDAWGSKGVIYNAYGPTEATIGVTMYCRVPENGRSSNIGKQFPNVGSFVLQPGSDVPVLRGGIGELCVSGKLVGKGYLNRSELTRARFPVLDRFGERVYRTGDLVRILHDGCFDFLGRADDQVKLRGQRLEIGEVNHVIKTGVSKVLDVATMVTKHRDQDRDVMVSFIVTDTSSINKRDLCVVSDDSSLRLSQKAQDACRAKLPSYMIPTYILCVPYIPLSANNKAQTSLLKHLFNSMSPEDLRRVSSGLDHGNAKLSKSQPDLARIIANVLRVNEGDILASTTIFELGFDSISVIELARQLRTAGFSGAAPSIILQNPRLGAMSKVLRKTSAPFEQSEVLRIKQRVSACYHRHLGAACRKFEVTQADIEYIAPCTSLQEGMLTRALSTEERAAYFNCFQLQLLPNISTDRLKEAWEYVVRANAVLRTGFLQTTDGYVQVAFRNPLLRWKEFRLEQDEVRKHLDQRYQEWKRSNESLFSTPLEMDCIQVGDRHTLIFRIFHGIYDARSLDLILQQIKAFYDGVVLPAGPSFMDVLPHGPLCDYSSTKSFWQDIFSNFSFRPVGVLKSEPLRNDAISTRSFDIRALEGRRIEEGVTQQTMFQAAWLSVLRQSLGFWPSIGVLVSGRSMLLDGIENTIGPLFNTLPFRIKNTAINNWHSLLQEIHHFNAMTTSFAHVPLRQVQKWCSNGQPLVDNLFSFAHEDEGTMDKYSPLWTDIHSTSIADYPIAFEGIATKDYHLNVTIVAKSHIFDEVALNATLDQFQYIIDCIASDSGFGDLQSKDIENHQLTNGLPLMTRSSGSQRPGDVDLIWTEQGRNVQKEIAALAGVTNDQVSQNTSLFELGLDSIDVVKLVGRLGRIGISLKTSQLMRQPTVRGIMSAYDSSQVQNGKKSSLKHLESEESRLKRYLHTVGVDLSGIDTVLPPTPLQDSMMAEMVVSDFQLYFNHDVLELAADTDMQVLKSAIETVIRKSPILRTSFVQVDDPRFHHAFIQVVAKKLDPFKEAVSVASLEETTTIMEHARQTAVNSKGQHALLQLTPVIMAERHYMVLSIAHPLYDGTSLGLFHQDIQAAYAGEYHQRESYTPTLANILDSSSESAENFWSNFLHDAPPTILPEKQIQNGRLVLGQACWSAVLSSLARSLNVTFGVILSGRSTEDEADLMFPMMNTVPVTTVLHGTIAEYLQYMWENMTNISEYQFFPLRKAQRIAMTGGGPLFNTLFIMQSQTSITLGDSPTIWRSVKSESEVEFPICVEMELSGEEMVWRVACHEQYASAGAAQSLVDQLDSVLEYLMRNEHGQLVDFTGNNAVSVCGLTPFTLREDFKETTPATDSSLSVNDGWSENVTLIIGVLAEVGGIDASAISPSQSIYHLGLDSISAIKVSSILRKRGIIVPVRDMIKAATIRDIAINAKGAQSGKANDSIPTTTESLEPLKGFELEQLITKINFTGAAVERVLPALPMQVHMLSAWQNSAGDLYFYQFSYEVTDDVSTETISKAWRILLVEVPIMRTYLVASSSSQIPFVQVLIKPDQLQTEPERPNTTTKTWNLRLGSTPFVSLEAVRNNDGVIKLQFKIHHALYDGVSLPLIVRRFAALCGVGGSAIPFDLSAWDKFILAHYTHGTKERRQMFWKTYLNGATQPRHNAISTVRHVRTAEFHPAALDLTKLKNMASESGISIQALFFAAYANCLVSFGEDKHVSAEEHDVVFGIYLANRTSFDEELQDAPCPMLAIVPLRVKFNQDERLVDIAKRVQDDLIAISSFEHASVGLWEISEWTGIKIATFVNFLSLPEQSPDHGADGEARFRETTPTMPQESHGYLVPKEGLAKPSDEWLSDNRVKEAYIDAIDVEAAVRGNRMDIGVFGSSSSLSKAQASETIRRIVRFLEDA
ncbi:hypothetical protein TruAng_005222 [Truncatella angustata]|nr:hypothetical protein TruAng_005222 [Truncatella angustata]